MPHKTDMLGVQEVESLVKSDDALLQSIGVGLPEVQAKARLMALLSLASASSQVRFDTIQVCQQDPPEQCCPLKS